MIEKPFVYGIPYKIAAFHRSKKNNNKPVFDSAVCYRTFQLPANRDVPRTEKRVTYNQIGNVPTKRLAYYNSATGLH